MIGALRHRMTLQAKNSVPDGFGGFLATWQDTATLWARIEESPGSFLPPATTRRVRVTLRWRADVRPGQRLLMPARLFLIENVTDAPGRRRMLMCDCVEEIVTA